MPIKVNIYQIYKLNIPKQYIYEIYITVVLLDTTREATLEWTRYPYGPQAQTPGVSL